MSKPTTLDEILNFWFSKMVKPLWFKKSADFDREIKQRFFDTYQLAKTGASAKWCNDSHDLLALIIVLDQFPRNMFRNTSQAFATDKQAVELAKYAISNNYQQNLSPEEQAFLYMPLMHSENKKDQAKCVELFTKLGREDNLKFAVKHQEVIARFLIQSLMGETPKTALYRFGRFPHRNEALGRESTPEEKEFLTQPGSSF